MRARNRLIETTDTDAINVSPLIDVVFILLIFFIVSATFVTLPGVEVTRPQAVTGKALEKNAVIFALSADNEIKYAGSTVQLEEIPGLVEQASKDKGKPVVFRLISGRMLRCWPRWLLRLVKNPSMYPSPLASQEHEKKAFDRTRAYRDQCISPDRSRFHSLDLFHCCHFLCQ